MHIRDVRPSATCGYSRRKDAPTSRQFRALVRIAPTAYACSARPDESGLATCASAAVHSRRRSGLDARKTIRSRDEWDKCVERGGPSLTVIRGKTHYAASLMSAADQQIPDDIRVVLEQLITETGR